MEAPAAEDRLTRLPDDLLHSILRDLPLRQAARTSALSRRWPRQWLRALATSPVVDFAADPDFGRRQSPAQAAATVNRCLSFHATNGTRLDALRVAFPYPFGAFRPDLVGWAALAVERGARELELDLTPAAAQAGGAQQEEEEDDDDEGAAAAILVLPRRLFLASNSLQRLALGRCSLRDVPPKAAGLAGLRSLALSHTDVTDDDVRGMLAHCRGLEVLSLRSCRLLSTVQVAGSKLRVLELVRCPGVRELEVAAPALESFALHGDIISKITGDQIEDVEVVDENGVVDMDDRVAVLFGVTPALRDAYVSHLGVATFIDDRYEFDYYNELESVASAATLTICSIGLKNLEWSYNFEFTMKMAKLQELQLLMASLRDDDVESIVTFFCFAKSPILDRLFIQLPNGEPADPGAIADWLAGEYEFNDTDDAIVLDNLTFVKVVNFRGSRCELRLIKFLMDNAPALEQLVLVTEGAPEDELLEDVKMGMSPDGARITVCGPSEDGSRNPQHTRLYYKEEYY